MHVQPSISLNKQEIEYGLLWNETIFLQMKKDF